MCPHDRAAPSLPLIAEVVDTFNPVERDVRDRQGNRFSFRIRPCKNEENRIDGAVLTLFDIDSVKNQQEQVR